MSNSSRHSLHVIPESTYGVTPNTPAFQTMRHTGTTLGLNKGSMVSEEIRSDRQIADFRHGTKQTGGDIMAELSYGTYDSFLEASLMGTWAPKAGAYTASTISAAAADNSINDSANALPVLAAGDRVTVAGFTGASTTANQAKLRVVSSTPGKMVLSGGVAFINDAAGEAVTVTTLTSVLKAGTTRRSFSVLRNFADQTLKPFHLFTGVELNKLTLSVAVNSIIKATFGISGKDFTAPTLTAPAGTTYVGQNNNAVIDSFNGDISEGGAAIATVTEISLTLENGIEPRFVIGETTTIRPSIGRSNLTGQITAYFEDTSLLEKFINETESALVFNLDDLAGNSYRFTLPRIKYTGGQPDTQGQGPVTLALPFQALLDNVSASQIVIERNAA